MSDSTRKVLRLAVGALVCIPALMALRFLPATIRAGRASAMAIHDTARKPVNIAPLAMVSVSEQNTGDTQTNAWVTLTWHRPPTVHEIDICEPVDHDENFFRGIVTFEDGSVVVMRATPGAGSPQRVTFPPRAIHSIAYPIDEAQRRSPRREELKIMGTLK